MKCGLNLAGHGRIQRQGFVSAVMNLRVP